MNFCPRERSEILSVPPLSDRALEWIQAHTPEKDDDEMEEKDEDSEDERA